MSRLSSPAAFRAYAESVGCTVWDAQFHAYYAPDRSRRVEFSESFPDRILVRDSALPLGKAVVSREGRCLKEKPVTQSMETDGGGEGRPQHKALPGEWGAGNEINDPDGADAIVPRMGIYVKES